MGLDSGRACTMGSRSRYMIKRREAGEPGDHPMLPKPIRGNCLCGGFQFEIVGPIGEVRLCHCDLCRRANGTAFSANARIPLERYRVIAGEDLISEYESSPGARRCFCSRCGSPVFARVAKDPDHVRIRLGTLEREADAEITAHVWVGSKARWDRLTWAIPSFERGIDGPPA
jgi:hypothetical protein